VSGVQIPPGP